jgi:hypothetical protein
MYSIPEEQMNLGKLCNAPATAFRHVVLSNYFTFPAGGDKIALTYNVPAGGCLIILRTDVFTFPTSMDPELGFGDFRSPLFQGSGKGLAYWRVNNAPFTAAKASWAAVLNAPVLICVSGDRLLELVINRFDAYPDTEPLQAIARAHCFAAPETVAGSMAKYITLVNDTSQAGY